jgi:CubicO group peptidase (beta-lactamase class C family)
LESLDVLQLRRRVERLTQRWNRPDTPGVAVGVVHDGELIVRHQAGMASLELGAPIGPETAFRIASVSKQFTCAAVLMLAAEGRLEVQDGVRQHIPELPDYGTRLTIAHLMHNTSGIRDMLALMRLGGADLGQPCGREDLLEPIFRQRSLNFSPGSRYLYSNSNFLLLGLLVERISGESFPRFLDRRIFSPLGMNCTRHTDSTSEIAPGLATGYVRDGGGWIRASHAFPLGGEGGLVSSVEDLALWGRALATGQLGATLSEALEKQAPFSNGCVNHYARGLSISAYRGVRTVQHGGDWPGYRTQFLRVPEAGLTVICISNDHTADPYHLANEILDAALEGRPGLHARPAPPPERELARWYGRYLDRKSGASLELFSGEQGPMGRSNGGDFRLIARDGRLVASRTAPDFAATLSDDGEALEVEFDAGVTARYHRVAAGAALPVDLAGVYENADVAATWTIAREGEAMMVRVAGPLVRNTRWKVEPVERDCVRINLPGNYRSWLDVRVVLIQPVPPRALRWTATGRASSTLRVCRDHVRLRADVPRHAPGDTSVQPPDAPSRAGACRRLCCKMHAANQESAP